MSMFSSINDLYTPCSFFSIGKICQKEKLQKSKMKNFKAFQLLGP